MCCVLVDEQEKVLAVYNFVDGMEDFGLFMIFVIVSVGIDVKDFEEVMDVEMVKVWEEFIFEQEF